MTRPNAPCDNTFSIVARCAATGRLAVAVSTARPAVGNRVPFVSPNVAAVATQADTNPHLGRQAITLIREGLSANDALETVLAEDAGRERRQLSIISHSGESAVFTGRDVLRENPWAGTANGANYAVAGNLLVGQSVLSAMAATFEASSGFIGERLLRVLEAGQAAGGDKRGKVSAAVLVTGDTEHPLLDLRVDLADDPVAALRALYETYILTFPI